MENVFGFLGGIGIMALVALVFGWRAWSHRGMDEDARGAWLEARAKRKARREQKRREREQQDE